MLWLKDIIEWQKIYIYHSAKQRKLFTETFHVVGLSDLVDLWVRKPMILCARSTRDQVNRIRYADHATRTRERFVYSIVTITRVYDYQTGQIFFEKFTRCAKVCGLFSWLCFSNADWLSRQTLITWLTLSLLYFSVQIKHKNHKN